MEIKNNLATFSLYNQNNSPKENELATAIVKRYCEIIYHSVVQETVAFNGDNKSIALTVYGLGAKELDSLSKILENPAVINIEDTKRICSRAGIKELDKRFAVKGMMIGTINKPSTQAYVNTKNGFVKVGEIRSISMDRKVAENLISSGKLKKNNLEYLACGNLSRSEKEKDKIIAEIQDEELVKVNILPSEHATYYSMARDTKPKGNTGFDIQKESLDFINNYLKTSTLLINEGFLSKVEKALEHKKEEQILVSVIDRAVEVFNNPELSVNKELLKHSFNNLDNIQRKINRSLKQLDMRKEQTLEELKNVENDNFSLLSTEEVKNALEKGLQEIESKIGFLEQQKEIIVEIITEAKTKHKDLELNTPEPEELEQEQEQPAPTKQQRGHDIDF